MTGARRAAAAAARLLAVALTASGTCTPLRAQAVAEPAAVAGPGAATTSPVLPSAAASRPAADPPAMPSPGEAGGDGSSGPGAARAATPGEADGPARREARDRTQVSNWRVEVAAPEDLRRLLLRYLDVARFTGSDGTDTITLSELSRLIAAAPAQARSLLETEGYFQAQVDAALELPPGAAPIVRLSVTPGIRATVQRLTVDVQGELAVRAEGGDIYARAMIESLQRDWGLQKGAAFTRAAWADAKARLLTRLRADAYPGASWSGTAAQVDPQTQAVRIFVVADSGPHHYFGPLRIEGLSRYQDTTVRRLATFEPGHSYSEKTLLDFQERLARAGLFDSVAVSIDPDPTLAAATPVLVRLRELQAQQATVGVGISADNGPRVTLEHVHRKPFGLNWQSTTALELGRDNRKLELDLISHAQPRGYRNLISGRIAREQAAGLIVRESQLRIGRTQDTERIERLYYLEWQDASVESDGLVTQVGAATGNYEWVWRRLDSNLLPTRGLAASAKVAAGRSFNASGDDTVGSGWFARASGRLTLYRPFGERWFTISRIEAGEVFARDAVAIPYPLLFRAGGDNSVRGYGYQEIGPDDVNGVPVGGRVLATASFEIARPISARRPEWLGAVFVDAGDAARNWQDYSPSVGIGAGLRWRSPVGPLSLDLAYGLEVRAFRLHFNVGIAF